MKKTYVIIGLFIMIVLIGCKSQDKTVEKSLKRCVNNSINEYLNGIYENSNLDFYELMKSTELVLNKFDLIKNESRQEYIKLFKSIIDLKVNDNSKKESYKKAFREILYILEKSKFDGNGYFIKAYPLKVCPFEILIKEQNEMSSPLRIQMDATSQLEANGFDNLEILKDLINNISDENFEKDIYRAPVILLVYLNLKLQFN